MISKNTLLKFFLPFIIVLTGFFAGFEVPAQHRTNSFGPHNSLRNKNHKQPDNEQKMFAAPKVDPQQSMAFVQNKNQWSEDVKYRADLPGGFLFLRENSLVYTFYDHDKVYRLRHGFVSEEDSLKALKDPESLNKVRIHGFEVSFPGAESSPSLIPSGQHRALRNYFLGNDQSKWASDVPAFNTMLYDNLYEGIDMKMYLKDLRLKYEFILEPGKDADQIRMKYRETSEIELKHGRLYIRTSVNEIIEQRPYSYQIIDGKEVEVPSEFVLKKNTVSFAFPEGYDKNYPLVIDPTLVFSTFSGSAADNWGNTATYGPNGVMYAAGTVFSPGFPATVGAFDDTFNGTVNTLLNVDIGVLKFSADGSSLLYATYIGGRFLDVPHSCIVNNNSELVIMGTTGSVDFPVTGSAYDGSFNGGPSIENILGDSPGLTFGFVQGADIFVLKLNGGGNTLTGSTFLGGSDNDGVNLFGEPLAMNYGDQFRGDLLVDESNNIYVSSMTQSTDFPMRFADFPVFIGTNQMATLTKFNANLSGILWSTYFGGTGYDAAYSLATNSAGEVYIGGGTTSNNLPTSATSDIPIYSGARDGFIGRFQSNGDFIGCTYVGTNAYNQVYFIDTDSDNENVYAFGQTSGAYPISPFAYGNPLSGNFIHAFNKNLSNTVLTTVIGAGRGGPDIVPTAFMVNECGQIYFAGWGGSTNSRPGYIGTTFTVGMPVTSDAIKPTTNGNDFYFGVLSRNATSLTFGSFFGHDGANAEHVDGGTSRFNKETGTIYHVACACGGLSDFPTTPGAWSVTNSSSNCNNAAFKINFDGLEAAFSTVDENDVPNVVTGCAPLTLRFDNESVNGLEYEWQFDSLATSTDETGIWITFPEEGEYQIQLIAINNGLCITRDTAYLTIIVEEVEFDIIEDLTICPGESARLGASGGTSYEWSPAESLDNPNIPNPVATPSETTTYELRMTAGSGCEIDTSVTVTVLPDLEADFDIEVVNPCDDVGEIRITNNSEGAESYSWDFGNGQTSDQENPPALVYNEDGTYTVTLIIGNEQCADTLTQEVNISTTGFDVSPDVTICAGSSVELFARGGTEYTWTPAESLDDPTSPTPVATPSETTTYQVSIRADGCELDTAVTVTVIPPVNADFEVDVDGECGDNPTVTITNKTTGAVSYLWEFGDGRTSDAENPPSYRYSEEGSYEIVLYVLNGNCGDTLAVPVTIVIQDRDAFFNGIGISEDTTICSGSGAQLFATGGLFYNWTPTTGLDDPNAANPVATPSQTTTYRVNISNGSGCESDTSVTVTVFPDVILDFALEVSSDCGKPSNIIFVNNSQGADTYVWDMGDGQTVEGQTPGEYVYSEPGTYTVTLRGINGVCDDVRTVTVNVDDATPPNVVTANNDGKNDVFELQTARSGWSLTVFNRWGREIFSSDNYRNEWGADAEPGVYFYTLVSPDGSRCKGWVQVLR